jgi:hypothetical protein
MEALHLREVVFVVSLIDTFEFFFPGVYDFFCRPLSD